MQKAVLNPIAFDSQKGIWVLEGFQGIPYSDGVEAERYILGCVQRAQDLSSASDELSRMVRDWPSQYHLSSARAQLLRGFHLDPAASALEIVARFGPVGFPSADCLKRCPRCGTLYVYEYRYEGSPVGPSDEDETLWRTDLQGARATLERMVLELGR